MKILVLVKETVDSNINMGLDNEKKPIPNKEVYVINRLDEFAIEEAVRIKERFGGEVVILTVGPESAMVTIRTALSKGGDRAILIKSEVDNPMGICEALKIAVEMEKDYDLILGGWVSYDLNNAQVPTRLGTELGIPIINNVTKITINEKDRLIEAERDNEEYAEIIETKLPAVCTVQRIINEPRLPAISEIMDVKYKEIKIIDFKKTTKDSKNIVQYSRPPKRRDNIKLINVEAEEAVDQLMAALKKAKLL